MLLAADHIRSGHSFQLAHVTALFPHPHQSKPHKPVPRRSFGSHSVEFARKQLGVRQRWNAPRIIMLRTRRGTGQCAWRRRLPVGPFIAVKELSYYRLGRIDQGYRDFLETLEISVT